MRVPFTVLCLSLLAPAVAFAQEPPPPPPPPPPAVEALPPVVTPPPAVVPPPAPVMVSEAPAAAPAAPTWKDALTVEGLVDSYYMINLMPPSGGGIGSSPTTVRQFDVMSNSFTLAYAKLGLGMSAGPAAFRIDLGYGHVGTIINGASASASGATGGPAASLYGNAFIAQQAYASLTPVDNLTIDFGKFVTNAGSEVIEANKNWLYSRSLLFFTIPLLHTGVRAGYKITPELLVQLSLVNGINNDPDVITVKDFGKTFGATVNYTAGPVVAIANVYAGKEVPGADTKLTVDLVGAFTASDKIGLNLNIDYIKLGEANTFGVAAMAKIGLSDALYFAGRAEYVKDKGLSFSSAELSLYEVTAMLGWAVGKNLEVRPELRLDGCDKEVFGAGSEAAGKKNQATLAVAVLAFI